MIIYKITNKLTGRSYVGQTVGSLGKRWSQHTTSTKNCPMYNAFRKYGRDNFTIETLCSALDPSYLNELEQFFIKYFNTLSPHGYNLTSGGDSAFTRSEESREKQRMAMTGRTPSTQTRIKISKTLTGRPGVRKGTKHSPATKALISAIQLGKKASEQTRKRMQAAHMGQKAYNARQVLCLNTGTIYGSTGEAARVLGLVQSSISAVCLGNRKSTGGLTFKYVDKSRMKK